jgi:hypothetical protein
VAKLYNIRNYYLLPIGMSLISLEEAEYQCWDQSIDCKYAILQMCHSFALVGRAYFGKIAAECQRLSQCSLLRVAIDSTCTDNHVHTLIVHKT